MAKNKNLGSETVEVVEKVTSDSPAKIAFQKLVDAYKLQNPTKYEIKKSYFEKKLASL